MARKVLYLLTKAVKDPLIESAPSDQETSVVLLQDGVSVDGIKASEVFVLREDDAGRNVPSGVATISYRDVLEKIFRSDGVVVL